MPTVITLLILFGTAFLVLPFGTSWYEIPKVAVFLLTSTVLSLLFFWKQPNWKTIHLSKLTASIYIGIAGITLISLFLQTTPTTFFGNIFRLQGVLLLWMLLLWSLYSPILSTTKKIGIIAMIALLGMVVAAFFGQTDLAGRAVGTIGEANSLGAFVLFLLPLTMATKIQNRYSLLFSVALVLVAGVCIFLSGSRSALVGLVIELIFFFRPRAIKLSLMTVVAIVILGASIALPFLEPRQDFDYRKDVWRTAVAAGMQRPILGWGIGNTEQGIEKGAHKIQTFPRFQYVDSSHNLFLDWWVQGGVIGLTLMSTLILLTIVGLIKKTETAYLASFLGILAVMLFNPVSVAILIPFWWLIGKSYNPKNQV